MGVNFVNPTNLPDDAKIRLLKNDLNLLQCLLDIVWTTFYDFSLQFQVFNDLKCFNLKIKYIGVKEPNLKNVYLVNTR